MEEEEKEEEEEEEEEDFRKERVGDLKDRFYLFLHSLPPSFPLSFFPLPPFLLNALIYPSLHDEADGMERKRLGGERRWGKGRRRGREALMGGLPGEGKEGEESKGGGRPYARLLQRSKGEGRRAKGG